MGASSIERLGINPRFGNPPRAMDSGHGGFYVTNDRDQDHRWARRQGEEADSGGPAVMHFQISRSELERLNGKRFGNDDEVIDFITRHRNDRNDSPMLLNLRQWRREGAPMDLGGHQIAFHQQQGVDLLSNGYAGRDRRR
ncbi:DUF3990 domain-containing protein [Kitasatospora cineracea]|uniref:DUF3990 domain-containing protein n=1 Tax=Kitasatospora cineracea TaxID=88074 RepID=UPI003408CD9C